MAGDVAACDGKRAYTSRAEAVAVAERMRKQKGGKGTRVYRCGVCGLWHCGGKRWKAKRPDKPRVKWWRVWG